MIDANPPVVVDGASVSGSITDRAGEIETPEGRINERQSAFIDAFIELGGRAEEAAIQAGYAGGASNMASRNLAKPKIQAEIVRRLKLRHGSALAIAIGNLLTIIEESEDDRARVQAALGIMDRFGMAPPRGPAATVNVNVMTAGAAQAVLQDVQKRREQRLSSQSAAPSAAIEHRSDMFDA